LWRYVSAAKLFDLVNTGELFFPSVSTLRDGDHREGCFSDVALEQARALIDGPDDAIEAWSAKILGAPTEAAAGRDIVRHMFGLYPVPLVTCVSCWHTNDRESMLMWSAYTKSMESMAIRTTVGRLCDALDPRDTSLVGGRVRYIDPKTHFTTVGNTFNPVFEKHVAFAGEAEFRIASIRKYEEAAPPAGVRIQSDVGALVDAVVLRPFAHSMELSLAQHILSKVGLEGRLVRSELE
jgi:hypothetical protein